MKKIKEELLHSGKWLSICAATFITKNNEEIIWETIRRRSSKPGVVILAQMMPSKRFVLIKQYRPASEGYVIGLPSGLADGDPAHALVELKEETGYVGTIIDVSPVLRVSSSVISDSGQIVYVHIDENDPANQKPQQQLEKEEDIEVFLVAKEEMRTFFDQQRALGHSIAANLWYLFILTDKIVP